MRVATVPPRGSKTQLVVPGWRGQEPRRDEGRDGDGGRNEGAGCHGVPWEGHFIPPREANWGCSTPTPSLLMLLKPHVPQVHTKPCLSATNPPQLTKVPAGSCHLLSFPGVNSTSCIFGINHLCCGQAKHFRRRSRALCVQGQAGNPGNNTKAEKKRWKNPNTVPCTLPQFPPASPQE